VQDGDTWELVGLCHNVTGPRLRAFNQGVALAPGSTLVAPHRDELVLNLNGERLALAVYSRLHGGRAVAHVRLAERLGATVTWNGHQVLIQRGKVQIAIIPGERIAYVNDIPIDMGTDAFRTEDRILVPVRFLAESLGVAVTWQSDTWVVELASN
jgi:N-acetylmuramoyl-L-alanine amidase